MSTQPILRAPFPYWGGKSRIAGLVWERFGDVPNFVEPFAGSLAVLLSRPHPPRIETVNDYDGLLANFWRAVQADPEAVARWADWPVNECDLHARHAWLVARKDGLQARLEGDPDYYDAKIAGWWVWGICCWIGGGWCSGDGPWTVQDGRLVNGGEGQGISRRLPHLGDAGRGIHRKRPHLGNAGQGIHRQLPHLGNAGRGIHRTGQPVADYMRALADRLRRVRICCGDWSRVCGPSVTHKHGMTAVFLDPPYSHDERAPDLYRQESATVAAEAREWAIANGDNHLLRIALCGYDAEHDMPETWTCVAWKAKGGYGSQGQGRGRENAGRERVWFSPHCLDGRQSTLGFADLEAAP